MSLRLRLSLILGSAFIIIWSLAAAWLLFDLRNQLTQALDQRLASSARMVAGLLLQVPQARLGENGITRLSAEHFGIQNGLACQVSSLRGEVIARSHSTPERLLNEQKPGFRNQLIDGEQWRSFTLLQNGMRITTADKLDERALLENSVLLASAIPVGMALLGTLIVLWFGIGNGLKPVERLRQALSQRAADATEPLSTAQLPKEWVPLVETQNQLFLRIAQTLKRERQLTNNAAHELRSPLTAIKTHLQVASMTQGQSSQQALHCAEQACDRLQHTLEQLLMLARIEGWVSFDDGTPCSAVEVAQTAIADCQQQNASAVHLSNQLQGPAPTLAMPAVLAITALRNLLDNACRHTQAGTTVELSVEKTAAHHLCYRITDCGQALSSEVIEHFTERFWRSGESDGCGLGLTIVQAIAERYHCQLNFEPRESGLQVCLSIPLQSV